MHRFRPAFMSQYSVGQMIFSQSEWRWWLFDKSAYEPAEMMDRYQRTGHSTGITLLGGKSNQQRHYYRLCTSHPADSPPYFAKQMMQRTHARLGALLSFDNPLLGCGHGTAELAHNLPLQERTGHGVRTFAFGELFRAGLPVRQVLLQEYLDGWQTFTSLWRQAIDAPALRRELLHKLMTMLAALRDAGIAHLDLHPGNIMVSPDPQAPLRTIDCGKMEDGYECRSGPRRGAASGVFCFVMNGERSPSSPRLEDGVRQLLYRLVGDAASFATAEGLLTLLLRYSSRRPFSRRLLLWPGRKSLDLEAIETRLKKLSRRRCASAVDAQSEQRLIESIEAFLNPAVERPILCATDREAAALPKFRHMRQAPRQTAQDRASAR